MTAEEALHYYYLNSGRSQPQLAARIVVSQATIHNWLSGKKKIPMQYYGTISEVCGVNLVWLLPDDWKILMKHQEDI